MCHNQRSSSFQCFSVKNLIGKESSTRKKNKKKPDFDKIFQKKTAEEVFKDLDKLPVLSEFERASLQRYKPSFTKQKLDFRNIDIPSLGRRHPLKARILYGNETDVNEYPWQISMWIDKSHFCGGTLITDQWIVTAAHCVDLQYKNHFKRISISLGDHDVSKYSDAPNVFRKLKRIIRFPTYDNNLIDGDLALLHLSDPVPMSSKIQFDTFTLKLRI